MEALRLELHAAQRLSQAEEEASRAAARRVMMAAGAVIAADRQAALDRAQARRAAMDAKALLLEPAWLISDLRARILDEFDGHWPAILDVATTGELGLPFPRQLWQATLFAQFIEGRSILSGVSPGECAAHLTVQDLHESETKAIVREWFDVLVAAGYLLCAKAKKKRYSIGAARVRYTTASKRTPKAQRASEAQSRAARESAARAASVRSASGNPTESARRSGHRSYVPPAPPVVDPIRPGIALCRDCARPLAAMFVARGYHLMCSPVQRY